MNIVIFITAKNQTEAKKIAKALLEKKLIACANITKEVNSFFWWQGKIDQAKEVLLILKTKRTLLKRLIKTVKAIHSYDVPEIIALPIIDGNKDYLKWIGESVLK